MMGNLRPHPTTSAGLLQGFRHWGAEADAQPVADEGGIARCVVLRGRGILGETLAQRQVTVGVEAQLSFKVGPPVSIVVYDPDTVGVIRQMGRVWRVPKVAGVVISSRNRARVAESLHLCDQLG